MVEIAKRRRVGNLPGSDPAACSKRAAGLLALQTQVMRTDKLGKADFLTIALAALSFIVNAATFAASFWRQ